MARIRYVRLRAEVGAQSEEMVFVAAEEPECRPGDLAVVLRWERSGDGLRGQVIAENVSDHARRLSGKPKVKPLGHDGELSTLT
jgi:hypothetical protein